MERSRQSLREAPADRDRLAVYADELLERADPRAELIRASLDGAPLDPWLEKHGAALRAGLGVDQLRFCHGLVHQLDYGLDGWLDLPPDVLAPHPLAFVVTPSFGKSETSAHAERLRFLLDVSAPFGLQLRASSDWSPLKRLAKTSPKITVQALRLPSNGLAWLDEVSLPNLRALWSPSIPPGALTRPFTEQLRWLAIRSLEHLDQILDWPALELLDLRTVSVDGPTEAKLRRWLERSGRAIVHERFSLADPHPLADVFSAAGTWWPRARAPDRAWDERRVASARHDEFASVTGTTIRGYLDGEPAWSKELPATVTTLVGHSDGYELLLSDGTHLSFERDGTAVAPRVAPQPRNLRAATSHHERAVIEGDDVVITELATGRELKRWTLGPGLEAIVSTASGFACASRLHLWHLSTRKPARLLHEAAEGRHLLLAANRSAIVASFETHSVLQTTEDGTRTKGCHWPSTFSRQGGELLVQALAVEDSGRAIVGLSDQALNLLDPESGQAFKPGEHHGQPYRHWVFIYEGSILVSD